MKRLLSVLLSWVLVQSASAAGEGYRAVFYNGGTTTIAPNSGAKVDLGNTGWLNLYVSLAPGAYFELPAQYDYTGPATTYKVAYPAYPTGQTFNFPAKNIGVITLVVCVVAAANGGVPVPPVVEPPPLPIYTNDPCVKNSELYDVTVGIWHSGTVSGTPVVVHAGETKCFHIETTDPTPANWALGILKTRYNEVTGLMEQYWDTVGQGLGSGWGVTSTNLTDIATKKPYDPFTSTNANDTLGPWGRESTLQKFAAASVDGMHDGFSEAARLDKIRNGLLTGMAADGAASKATLNNLLSSAYTSQSSLAGIQQSASVMDTTTKAIDSDIKNQSLIISNGFKASTDYMADMTNSLRMVSAEASTMTNQLAGLSLTLTNIAANTKASTNGGSGTPSNVTNNIDLADITNLLTQIRDKTNPPVSVTLSNSAGTPSGSGNLDANMARGVSEGMALSNTIMGAASGLLQASDQARNVTYDSGLSAGTIAFAGVSIDLNPFTLPWVSELAIWCRRILQASMLLLCLTLCSEQLRKMVEICGTARQTTTNELMIPIVSSGSAAVIAAAITVVVGATVAYLTNYMVSKFGWDMAGDFFAATPALAVGLTWLDKFVPISFIVSSAITMLYVRYVAIASMGVVISAIRWAVL